MLPFRCQSAGQFPLTGLAEHAAQLPDALRVIGHPQAVLAVCSSNSICRMVGPSVSLAFMATGAFGILDGRLGH
jgi:hypothetical protein